MKHQEHQKKSGKSSSKVVAKAKVSQQQVPSAGADRSGAATSSAPQSQAETTVRDPDTHAVSDRHAKKGKKAPL